MLGINKGVQDFSFEIRLFSLGESGSNKSIVHLRMWQHDAYLEFTQGFLKDSLAFSRARLHFQVLFETLFQRFFKLSNIQL